MVCLHPQLEIDTLLHIHNLLPSHAKPPIWHNFIYILIKAFPTIINILYPGTSLRIHV